MAHKEQFDYIFSVRNSFPDSFKNVKVLEVGSLNLNGSVRVFFQDCDYLGIDVGPGKDVDLVVEGQDYDGPDNSFDTVVSCECFEHNEEWVDTFLNMHRVCSPGGLLIMTCATTGRREHGTRRSEPSSSPLTCNLGRDYYKNLTEQDFKDNFNLDELFTSYEFSVNEHSHDLRFYGLVK